MDIEERAYKAGAIKHYTIDAKRDFAEGPRGNGNNGQRTLRG